MQVSDSNQVFASRWLQGRTAVVTGAGSGIGRACAERLHTLGASVVAMGRRAAPLHALAEHCPGTRVVPLDVGDGPAVRQALGGLERLEVLVLSAGLCATAPLGDGEAVWRAVMRTNLDGVFHALEAAQPRLVRGGRVVVVSSGLGKHGRAGYAAYCAAKHGVIGLVRAAAREWAPRGITINAVCPGWVETPMAQADLARAAREQGQSVADVRRAAEADIPLGRFVQASEVADLIAFLTSPAAAMITGEAYNLSGGAFD